MHASVEYDIPSLLNSIYKFLDNSFRASFSSSTFVRYICNTVTYDSVKIILSENTLLKIRLPWYFLPSGWTYLIWTIHSCGLRLSSFRLSPAELQSEIITVMVSAYNKDLKGLIYLRRSCMYKIKRNGYPQSLFCTFL